MHKGPLILGIILILLGGVWLLQGVGILGGSVMTGQTFWATVGGILLLVGLVVCAYALRPSTAGPPR
jgi:hypothetical protein